MSIEEECAAAAEGVTVPALLRRNAVRFPDLPALSTTDRTLTWSRLRAEVAAVARGLADFGLASGDRMLIMMSSRPEHWIADLAAVHLGALPGTAYATLSPEQIVHVAGRSAAEVVVLEGAEELRRWSEVLNRLPALRRIIVVDDAELPDDPHFVRWEDVRATGTRLHEADPEVFERAGAEIRSHDPVTMLFTSGTTGDPTGVVLSHHNVFYEAAVLDRLVPTPMHSTAVAYLPLAHIAERELSVYRALFKALHVSVCPDQSEVLRTLAFVRPPAFFGVPRVWEKIASGLRAVLDRQNESQRESVEQARALALEVYTLRAEGKPVPADLAASLAEVDGQVLYPIRAMVGLDALRWGSSGAAPLSTRVLEFLASLGIDVLEVWGMTETTACVTVSTSTAFKPGSVGRVVPGVEVRIADDGEIFVRGPVVCLGVLDASGAIVPAVDDDGWLATGDLGGFDEEGYLAITGRKKELIITSTGKNVAPSTIEGPLGAHPLVGHAVAVGDDRPYITALITLDEDGAPSWARNRGLDDVAAAGVAALAEHPAVRAELDRLVDEVNGSLSRADRVKKYAVLPKPFRVSSGELTPTLKLRRAVVLERYAAEIDALYSA